MSRILLIDPEPYLVKALAASPVIAGHEVVAAGGDVDALRRLRLASFDVVVTSPVDDGRRGPGPDRRSPRHPARHRSIVLTSRASREEVLAGVVRGPRVRRLLEAVRLR